MTLSRPRAPRRRAPMPSRRPTTARWRPNFSHSGEEEEQAEAEARGQSQQSQRRLRWWRVVHHQNLSTCSRQAVAVAEVETVADVAAADVAAIEARTAVDVMADAAGVAAIEARTAVDVVADVVADVAAIESRTAVDAVADVVADVAAIEARTAVDAVADVVADVAAIEAADVAIEQRRHLRTLVGQPTTSRRQHLHLHLRLRQPRVCSPPLATSPFVEDVVVGVVVDDEVVGVSTTRTTARR